jgi:hypothetical protein
VRGLAPQRGRRAARRRSGPGRRHRLGRCVRLTRNDRPRRRSRHQGQWPPGRLHHAGATTSGPRRPRRSGLRVGRCEALRHPPGASGEASCWQRRISSSSTLFHLQSILAPAASDGAGPTCGVSPHVSRLRRSRSRRRRSARFSCGVGREGSAPSWASVAARRLTSARR